MNATLNSRREAALRAAETRRRNKAQPASPAREKAQARQREVNGEPTGFATCDRMQIADLSVHARVRLLKTRLGLKMTLADLDPGMRFSVFEDRQRTGTLIKVNGCRALVRFDAPPVISDFADGKTGKWVRIVRPVESESVTPSLEVIVIG